jgi:hypothetical protein
MLTSGAWDGLSSEEDFVEQIQQLAKGKGESTAEEARAESELKPELAGDSEELPMFRIEQLLEDRRLVSFDNHCKLRMRSSILGETE